MPRSPAEMLAIVAANLPKRTGRSIREWVSILRKDGPENRDEHIVWLKSEYGLGAVTAEVIAIAAADGKSDYDEPDKLVDKMYSGKRALLRPIHDKLIEGARKLGIDVEIAPRKSYVALRRNRVWGVIQPATQSRVDLGLVLAGVKGEGRLQRLTTRWASDRITHRVGLTSTREVDAQVRRWLKAAYEGDA